MTILLALGIAPARAAEPDEPFSPHECAARIELLYRRVLVDYAQDPRYLRLQPPVQRRVARLIAEQRLTWLQWQRIDDHADFFDAVLEAHWVVHLRPMLRLAAPEWGDRASEAWAHRLTRQAWTEGMVRLFDVFPAPSPLRLYFPRPEAASWEQTDRLSSTLCVMIAILNHRHRFLGSLIELLLGGADYSPRLFITAANTSIGEGPVWFRRRRAPRLQRSLADGFLPNHQIVYLPDSQATTVRERMNEPVHPALPSVMRDFFVYQRTFLEEYRLPPTNADRDWFAMIQLMYP